MPSCFQDRLIILYSFGGCVISGFEVIEEGSSSIPCVGSVGRRMPGLNRVTRAYKILSNLLNLLKDSVTITLVIVDTAACPRSVCSGVPNEKNIAHSNILTVTNCFLVDY